MEKNKKVILRLYSEKNLGDDLFLNILLNRYPNTNFYLEATNDYLDIFSRYSNLKVFNNIKKRTFYDKVLDFITRKLFKSYYKKRLINHWISRYQSVLENFDIFLCLGGSMFMQYRLLPFYKDLELYNFIQYKYPEKPSLFIGCNFGPYQDEKYFLEVLNIFKKATDVCFRETKSYNLFKELENVRMAPDIVFGLHLKNINKISNSIGFSIVAPDGLGKNFEEESYINKYVELIELYISKKYIIRMFSFSEKEGDLFIINKILSKIINKSNIEIINYEGDLDLFLDKYQEMERVYCGRFHAMILSMLYNQKIYPIIYSDKMLNVLNDINYTGNYINVSNFYNSNVQDLYSQMNENHYELGNVRDNSNEHFKQLDKLLL